MRLQLFTIFIILSLLSPLTNCEARLPVALCQLSATKPNFPILKGELIFQNLSNIFSGYNLNNTIVSIPNDVYLSSKLEESNLFKGKWPNIISHRVQESDNSWGEYIIVLSREHSTITLTYGDKQRFPTLSGQVNIATNDPSTKCFGVALFSKENIAIVDCIELISDPLSSTSKNYFNYVNMITQRVYKTILNPTSFEFKRISKRKVLEYINTETRKQYLIRAYLSDGLTPKQSTFLEIWTAINPEILYLQSTINSTTLGVHSLSILDFQIYLGDLFILDAQLGLFRLSAFKTMKVQIVGHYKKAGFKRFALYYDEIRGKLTVALATELSVTEIEWKDSSEVTLRNRFSLMEQSEVTDLAINQDFVIVQASALVEDTTGKKVAANYTWIFNKESVTYGQAHLVISHASSSVALSFNRDTNQLFIFSEQQIVLYNVGFPILMILPTRYFYVGSSFDIIIRAESRDDISSSVAICEQTMTMHYVAPETIGLWETGKHPAHTYSFNRIEIARIPLDDFAIGPDLRYTVINSKPESIPEHVVEKAIATPVAIDKPTPGNIKFFSTQSFDNRVLYFYQQSDNAIQMALCTIMNERNPKVICQSFGLSEQASRVLFFSTAWMFMGDTEYMKYCSIRVLESEPKKLLIWDLLQRRAFVQITYIGALERISDAKYLNKRLYVLLAQAKTINVYAPSECSNQECKLLFQITAESVKYDVESFQPKELIVHEGHPNMLFIKCKDIVLVLQISSTCRIKVLSKIDSLATLEKVFHVVISKDWMFIVAQPDLLEEYYLFSIQTKFFAVPQRGILPLYGFKLPETVKVEVSDNSLLYLNAYDQKQNKSVILVYRTGAPLATSHYSVLALDKENDWSNLHFTVSSSFLRNSGVQVDLLSIVHGKQFSAYTVFKQPFLTFYNASFDFGFDINITNAGQHMHVQNMSFSIENTLSELAPTEEFNRTMANSTVNPVGSHSWKDRKWFNGSVLEYQYTCDECSLEQAERAKVEVISHVGSKRKVPSVRAKDYIETTLGGISVGGRMLKWHRNGSAAAFIDSPSTSRSSVCLKAAISPSNDFAVTACQEAGTGTSTSLFVTSLVSFKHFTWGPFLSSSSPIRKLQICQGIIMAVMVITRPGLRFQPGKIVLHQLLLGGSQRSMEELEVIDQHYFRQAAGWSQDNAYIGNGHLVYSSNQEVFRLYATEINNGIFVVHFTKQPIYSEITVLRVSFIDLKQLLADNGFTMPSDATFTEVTRLRFEQGKQTTFDNILVSTEGYHNFELIFIWDLNQHLISTLFHRVYYRYSYYLTSNSVKASNGFLAIQYSIPFLETTNLTQTIIAVYDTNEYKGDDSSNGYSERYIMGALKTNSRLISGFAFNSTQSSPNKTVLLVLDFFQTQMISAEVSNELTVHFQGDVSDQLLVLTPRNEFHEFSFNVAIDKHKLGHGDVLESSQQYLVFLCGLSILMALCYVAVKTIRRKNQNGSQLAEFLEDHGEVEPRDTTSEASR